MDDLASLISSVGTVIATAVSLYLLRQGQLDRRSLRDEHRLSQARMITIWADWNPDSPARDFDQPHVPAINVANASNEAVYEVFVDYRGQSDGNPVRIDFGAQFHPVKREAEMLLHRQLVIRGGNPHL